MAQVEPMDVDGLASDFDDKENSLQNSNVFKSPNTEKGYEDLDASEFNMKLRYSVTPANSPMSRSYTANSVNNTVVIDNNLTRSLNTTATKSDILKSPKLPLQTLPASLYTNSDRRSCDREGNLTVCITGTENEDNLSLPSTSSSAVQTPEATTPTKEIPKSDGSPIMRGLKSVLNMFRSSHSPIPPLEDDPHHENVSQKTEREGGQSNPQLVLSSTPTSHDSTPINAGELNPVLASTPISSNKIKDMKDSSKRNSLLKESVVFNDDLERELQWQDETEIYFKNEKIPIHKLLFPSGQLNVEANTKLSVQNNDINNLNTTVEYMDVSNADVTYKSIIEDNTSNDFKVVNNDTSGVESDNEFVDCETTYTQNKSYILETVQENQILPIVLQTDNIAHETCCEDYIEPLNMFDNINKDTILIDDKKVNESEDGNEPVPVVGTNNLTLEELLNNSNNLPEGSKIASGSCTSLEDTDKSFKIDNTSIPFELPIDDHIKQGHYHNLNVVKENTNHADDINNGNVIDSTISANKSSYKFASNKVDEELIKTNNLSENDVIPPHIEYPIATNLSIEDNSILQVTDQINNLIHESCIDTTNYVKDDKYSDIEIPSNVLNLHTSNIIMKAEDTNFDTDDINTTRLLFDIDALLLNQLKSNRENDIVSNYTEDITECINDLEISNPNVINTSENDLSSEHRTLDETVVITNNEILNEIMSNSLGNESTLACNAKVDDNNTLHTANKEETVAIEKTELQNFYVDKTSEFEINVHMNINNSLSLSDPKEQITEIACGTTTINDVIHSEMVYDLDVNNVNEIRNNEDCIVVSLNNDDSQDITMDCNWVPNLEPNLNQLKCEIKTDTNHHYSQPIELQNYLSTDLPLPLDIPLPSDDDNEKLSLLDPSSIKHKNDAGVMSEIEIEKKTCMKNDINSDCKETLNMLNPSQVLNDQVPLLSDDNNERHSSLDTSSIKHKNDVEVISEIEIEKTCIKNDINSDCKATMNILNPSQVLNEQVRNVADSEDFNMCKKTHCDVEMAAICSNIIQETPFSQIESNNKEFQQNSQLIPSEINELYNLNDNVTRSETVNPEELNVAIKSTATMLPDVLHSVHNTPGKDDLNTYETKTDITNETICLEYNMKTNVIEEEIVTSANNSPYVSVTDLDSTNVPVVENYNLIHSQIERNVSPPISPKCNTKGYNINFDDIENPFATKTNIRMSPTPEEVSKKSFTPLNNNQKTEIVVQRRPPIRRMSQPEGKKSDINKKRLNKSIDTAKIADSNKSKKSSNRVHTVQENNTVTSNTENLQNENSLSVKSEVVFADNKTVTKISPEVENKTDFNIQNLDNDILQSKNVFNIPEIDDTNFNPFATKSRICVTPPPALELKVPSNNMEIVTECKNINDQINDTVCIKDSIQNEVQVSSNTNNATTSSINMDKDVTVREVNTEDEDTVEGPFFEAEELVDVVTGSNIEQKKDTFEDLPTISNIEDIEKGELFIDAEAFEFLLNQNKSNVVADSGKESLFLKFDPLFAKRVSSDGVLAALTAMQKRQSTPKKMTRVPLVNYAREETPLVPTAGPSNVASISEANNTEIVNTMSKPMMVVNPAVAKQPVATPRISLTPKTNRQSLNFTSPAMVVIDRLLSLSGNTSLLDQDVTTAAASRNHDANIVLVQLRELLAEKELHVHGLRNESKELRDRLSTLESQVKSLENEGEERLRKVNNLNERLTEKTKINKSMAVVVEEYERTIASLIAEMEQEKKRNAEERMRLISERDEQTAHLASMEASFSDLNSKYEKCKQIIMSMKANEDAYKKSLKEFDENLLKMQKNYDLLKQHATSKLNHANQELEKINKTHDADVLKLTAMIKRKELHITSLEESLTQKKKAIEELTAICDELINKVG